MSGAYGKYARRRRGEEKCMQDFGVLYGCETWWLTLRGERGLRVFENRVKVKVSHDRPRWP
jgi:hypothetical protein